MSYPPASYPPALPAERNATLTEACSGILRQGRMRSAEAEDIAQEACARAIQVKEPSAIRDPVRYLFRTMRNLMVDRRRAKIREAALIGSLTVVELNAGTPDPERVFAGKQELSLVLAAIGRLPPRCREAFVLHRFQGLSYAAIARRMGVSTSMVEKHIAEAMLRITRTSQGNKEKAL